MKYNPYHVGGEPLPLYKILGAVAARIVEGTERIPVGLERQLAELYERLLPAFDPQTKYASYSDQELADLLDNEWLKRRESVRWLEGLGIAVEEQLPFWSHEIVQALRGLR